MSSLTCMEKHPKRSCRRKQSGRQNKLKKINLKNKKVSVIGAARSGTALAEVLTRQGAEVLISDCKSEDELKDVREKLSHLQLQWETGGHTDRVYKDRDLVIISPGVSIHSEVVQNARQAGVKVISEVELAFLLGKAPFIAVTGTNGKSTTVSLIHSVITEAGYKSYLAGNIGIPLIGEVEKIPPDAWVCAEISSFQLEAVDRFRPRVGLLLNITADHLDRHKSFEEYKMAKANLFKNQTPDDFAILNADDDQVVSLVPRIQSRKLYFSRKKRVFPGAYFENGFIKWTSNHHEQVLFPWEMIPLKGVHNLENVLAAVCATRAIGIKPGPFLKALQEFKPLHYRMEYVDTIGGIKFYNDSKGTNPDAIRASLESFREPVVIIAGGYDKGFDFAPLAQKINQYAHGAVLIGQARNKIADALKSEDFDNYRVVDDMSMQGFKSAIKKAFQMCPGGGVVLLSPSCASFDMFRRAEHRGAVFNKFVEELKKEYYEKEV